MKRKEEKWKEKKKKEKRKEKRRKRGKEEKEEKEEKKKETKKTEEEKRTVIAAKCKAVQPCIPAWLTLAPAWMRTCVRVCFPFAAAQWRGDHWLPSTSSTDAPFFSISIA